MTISEHNLLEFARGEFSARNLPFDGEASIGLTFSGDVVVLGVEGADAVDPYEECVFLAPASALEEGLRRALWDATMDGEAFVLRERSTTRAGACNGTANVV